MEKQKTKLYFIGDIHKDWILFEKLLEVNDLRDAYIIHVGDFCVGYGTSDAVFERHAMTFLNGALAARNLHFYGIRGNHDNPGYYRTTRNLYNLPYITLLADYAELELLGVRMLLVGGATSIDKWRSTEGIDFWKDEVFEYRDDFPYKEYDLIVTHTRPIESGIMLDRENIKFHIDKYPAVHYALDEEEQKMSKFYERVKNTPYWIFGHMHSSIRTTVNGTTFKLLDRLEPLLFKKT